MGRNVIQTGMHGNALEMMFKQEAVYDKSFYLRD
jgi:hypothetical protein